MIFRKCLYHLLACVFCWASFPLAAQEITGNITGTVTDPTGAIVENARITVTNTATGVSRSTQTTSAGVFYMSSLPVGNYRLTVESPGFKRYEATGIRLDVNDRLNFPIALAL